MKTVKNYYDVEIYYNAIAFDPEIVDKVADEFDTTAMNEQEFFEAYCKMYMECYGEECEYNKQNPCY